MKFIDIDANEIFKNIFLPKLQVFLLLSCFHSFSQSFKPTFSLIFPTIDFCVLLELKKKDGSWSYFSISHPVFVIILHSKTDSFLL